MAARAWWAAVALVIGFGCGAESPGPDPVEIDAASASDANPCAESCSPFANTGCPAGRKCAPHPGSPCGLACVPEGAVPLGEPCSIGPDDVDDCVGTTACRWGACRQLCSSFAPCAEGACFELAVDLAHDVRVCSPACDPTTPNCPEGLVCGGSACVPAP